MMYFVNVPGLQLADESPSELLCAAPDNSLFLPEAVV